MHLLIIEKQRPRDLALLESRVREAFPAINVHGAGDEHAALAAAPQCEALIAGGHAITQRLIDATPGLRWIQALTSGVDAIERLNFPVRPLLTSVRGIHGPQMAELAVLLMLAGARDFPRMLRNQEERRWERWPQPMLCGKTVVILGVGAVAEALAARCSAFEMHVLGVSSRSAAPGFERIFPRSELGEALALADFLVVLLPYSEENHMLLDGRVLEQLKPGCVLINLARGRIVDEAALRAQLAAGRLHAAGLDVFATEPLPSDDPIWSAPGVIVTPHIGGLSDAYAEQCLPVVLHNLDCYLRGKLEEMRNVIWTARRQR